MSMKDFDSLEAGIYACFGNDVRIEGRSYVGGGDINDSYCLSLSNGASVFVKTNTVQNSGFFRAEEEGINAIASTKAIQTPQLLCKGIDKGRKLSFLMMDMIQSTGKIRDFWETFGRELAAMHISDTDAFVSGGRFGFRDDNYIGAGEQLNTPRDTWIDFFRECRLKPQFQRAEKYFDKNALRLIQRLLDRLGDILIKSLLCCMEICGRAIISWGQTVKPG